MFKLVLFMIILSIIIKISHLRDSVIFQKTLNITFYYNSESVDENGFMIVKDMYKTWTHRKNYIDGESIPYHQIGMAHKLNKVHACIIDDYQFDEYFPMIYHLLEKTKGVDIDHNNIAEYLPDDVDKDIITCSNSDLGEVLANNFLTQVNLENINTNNSFLIKIDNVSHSVNLFSVRHITASLPLEHKPNHALSILLLYIVIYRSRHYQCFLPFSNILSLFYFYFNIICRSSKSILCYHFLYFIC